MLTMSAEDDELFEAIANGASGYLLKTQDTDEVFALLQDVARGEVALSPGLASRVLNEFRRRASVPPGVEEKRPAESLSLRETQVLTLVAQGLTYKEVGAKLNLSERTIKYHMGEIVGRLHLESRAQAIEYARRAGMVRVARAPPRRAQGAPAPFLSVDCPPGTWSRHARGVNCRSTVLTVVLYGNSLALSGVGASLEAHPGLRIVRVDAVDAVGGGPARARAGRRRVRPGDGPAGRGGALEAGPVRSCRSAWTC